MSNYDKGARQENQLKKIKEAEGAYVIRSAGSKGLFDLVVIYPKHTQLIQVKTYGQKVDLEPLWAFPLPHNTSIWIYYKPFRKDFIPTLVAGSAPVAFTAL